MPASCGAGAAASVDALRDDDRGGVACAGDAGRDGDALREDGFRGGEQERTIGGAAAQLQVEGAQRDVALAAFAQRRRVDRSIRRADGDAASAQVTAVSLAFNVTRGLRSVKPPRAPRRALRAWLTVGGARDRRAGRPDEADADV